jgi:hypothetical protein
VRLTASGKQGVDAACERALEQTERALPTHHRPARPTSRTPCGAVS